MAGQATTVVPTTPMSGSFTRTRMVAMPARRSQISGPRWNSRVAAAFDALGQQPGLGAPPAVVGEMRIRALLALDRQRQPVGRRLELAHAQDGVARLGQGLDGGADGHGGG
jgi:hypothetical protein